MMNQKQTLTRRQALKLMGIGSAGVYLAACAPAVSPSATEGGQGATQERKVISISHIGGGSVESSEESQRMQLLRANFPDIEFENRWVSYAGYLENWPSRRSRPGTPPTTTVNRSRWRTTFTT
jgi:hypothetical protein